MFKRFFVSFGIAFVCLASVGAAVVTSNCATVDPVVHDIENCAGPEMKPAAWDVGKAAAAILACDALSGGAGLSVCAEQGLASLAAALGPDGKLVVDCVVAAIEADKTKPAKTRVAAKAFLAKRAATGISVKYVPPVSVDGGTGG